MVLSLFFSHRTRVKTNLSIERMHKKSAKQLRDMLGKHGARRHIALCEQRKQVTIDEAGNSWYPMQEELSEAAVGRVDNKTLTSGTGPGEQQKYSFKKSASDSL